MSFPGVTIKGYCLLICGLYTKHFQQIIFNNVSQIHLFLLLFACLYKRVLITHNSVGPLKKDMLIKFNIGLQVYIYIDFKTIKSPVICYNKIAVIKQKFLEYFEFNKQKHIFSLKSANSYHGYEEIYTM